MRSWLFACLVAAGPIGASPVWPASNPALTAPELDRLRGSARVVRTERVPDFPWPEVTVYRRIRAAPEQVMGVYVDFGSQTMYMPGLVASRVVKRDGTGGFHVFYEYEVSGPNERYVVAITVARVERGFQASWDLLAARYARRLGGRLLVEPFDGGTLVTYTSRVDPGTLGTMFGTPESVGHRLEASIEALAARVEGLAAEQPRYLAHLVGGLASIVDGP
jgi:hypothetical protein